MPPHEDDLWFVSCFVSKGSFLYPYAKPECYRFRTDNVSFPSGRSKVYKISAITVLYGKPGKSQAHFISVSFFSHVNNFGSLFHLAIYTWLRLLFEGSSVMNKILHRCSIINREKRVGSPLLLKEKVFSLRAASLGLLRDAPPVELHICSSRSLSACVRPAPEGTLTAFHPSNDGFQLQRRRSYRLEDA